ncbi:MAG: Gfo/Idh/MocA family oxidoreductase [Acidimicrobiales bacterium]|nr:Gfo/Idh/MocA family oxidoreductase [Acidimicrobiales bacterium]
MGDSVHRSAVLELVGQLVELGAAGHHAHELVVDGAEIVDAPENIDFGPLTRRWFVPRDERPDGRPYERGEDSAVMTLGFESGAYATVQTSAVCWEGTAFGQTHEFDAHGTNGTLYATCDWEARQDVRGVKAGDRGPAAELTIPDDIWAGVRRDTVHNTYRDVFRGGGAMIGDFIRGVQTHQPCEPSFAEGLRIQQLCDAAVKSAAVAV